ncbi:MAG: hypothetical protein GDA53_09085 [Rhodobacteraceae bacterium]|nr:hypothetical protein [Paracoccaceae bacterium]
MKHTMKADLAAGIVATAAQAQTGTYTCFEYQIESAEVLLALSLGLSTNQPVMTLTDTETILADGRRFAADKLDRGLTHVWKLRDNPEQEIHLEPDRRAG